LGFGISAGAGIIAGTTIGATTIPIGKKVKSLFTKKDDKSINENKTVDINKSVKDDKSVKNDESKIEKKGE
jgi:hypothetical protein